MTQFLAEQRNVPAFMFWFGFVRSNRRWELLLGSVMQGTWTYDTYLPPLCALILYDPRVRDFVQDWMHERAKRPHLYH